MSRAPAKERALVQVDIPARKDDPNALPAASQFAREQCSYRNRG
jgi:hypothetical protein